jgi:hypothetical protein
MVYDGDGGILSMGKGVWCWNMLRKFDFVIL